MLKALGSLLVTTPALVMLESTLLMVLGGTAGLAIARGGDGGQPAMGVACRLAPDQVLLGVVMVATGVVAGLVPAVRAQRLPVVEALRSVRR